MQRPLGAWAQWAQRSYRWPLRPSATQCWARHFLPVTIALRVSFDPAKIRLVGGSLKDTVLSLRGSVDARSLMLQAETASWENKPPSSCLLWEHTRAFSWQHRLVDNTKHVKHQLDNVTPDQLLHVRVYVVRPLTFDHVHEKSSSLRRTLSRARKAILFFFKFI